MSAPLENIAQGLASLGRFEDNYIVHAAEGETVVPAEVLESNPKLKTSLFNQMRAMGIDQPERYVVGNELNSINPQTGQPEFFFKSIGKTLKKAAPIIGSVVGGAIGGPVGAAIGGGLGSLAGGASPEQALINAGLSFAGAKFIGPGLDKALAGTEMMGPTVGSSLSGIGGEALANALPQSLSRMGIGTAAALALAPAAGGMISDALKPEEVAEPNRRSVVDEYYAALARGENPPLPPELTPPPQDSLFGLETQAPPPTYDEILVDPVYGRPMFRQAAYGGYIKGPGGPRDDKIPTLLSNTEFVQTGKAVAGADPTGQNNPDRGAKTMMGIMRAFEQKADENARAMAQGFIMATQTVEQITRLAPFMEDYVRKLLESGYQRVKDPVDIPVQQVAALTPEQIRAGQLVDQGIGTYQPLLDQSKAMIGSGTGLVGQGAAMMADPNAYRSFMSPYTSEVIDRVGQDIAEQTRMQQNQLGATAVGAGAFGGSRQGVAEGEIGKAGLRSFGDVASRLRESGFLNAQNLVGQRAAGLGAFGGQLAGFGGQLANLAGQTRQLGQQDISNLLGIGSLGQQQNQAVLDAQRATALQRAYEPFQRLGFFSDLVRGVPSSSSTIGVSTAPNQSPLSQIAGIAATGLGLAGQLGYRPFGNPTAFTQPGVV